MSDVYPYLTAVGCGVAQAETQSEATMDAERPVIEDDLLVLAAGLMTTKRTMYDGKLHVVLTEADANLIAGQLLRAAAMLRPPQSEAARLAAKYPIRG